MLKKFINLSRGAIMDKIDVKSTLGIGTAVKMQKVIKK